MGLPSENKGGKGVDQGKGTNVALNERSRS
jgi:hypothetical protein